MVLKTVNADDVPLTYRIPHRERLVGVLEVAREVTSLDMATFWATDRTGKTPGHGCLLGHYVMKKAPRHLELVPLNFLEQLKSPLHASRVLKADYLPNAKWKHYTLHYHGPDVEAWGLSAACLYFQLGLWDVQTLFWPAGYDNAIVLPAANVTAKLGRFIKAAPTTPAR